MQNHEPGYSHFDENNHSPRVKVARTKFFGYEPRAPNQNNGIGTPIMRETGVQNIQM